ncbi:hypothetical protein DYH09_19520 [bacterium CPR1]|nr:hypothetical protein [bacterium CPR1]
MVKNQSKSRLVSCVEVGELELRPPVHAALPVAVPGRARWTCQVPHRGGQADQALKRLKHSARLYYTLATGLSR